MTNSSTTNSSSVQNGVDPRGLRFVAGVTGLLLLVAIGLWLSGLTVAAFIVLAWITLVFAWGVFIGIRRNPYSVFFRLVIRPRMGAPKELEDATPPTFAQGMGMVITFVGLVLSLIPGVGLALPIAAGLAFIAAFLNSVFAYCIGCQVYLLLVRLGVLGKTGTPAAA